MRHADSLQLLPALMLYKLAMWPVNCAQSCDVGLTKILSVQVCLLVIAQGSLGIAMKISTTMMRRGHLKETAKVSRYLVAAGHMQFKECLAGELSTQLQICHHLQSG